MIPLVFVFCLCDFDDVDYEDCLIYATDGVRLVGFNVRTLFLEA